MRVLMIRPGPSFSVQDVAFGWRDGLREIGCEVADFNFDDRIDLYHSAEMNRGGEYRQLFSHEAAIQMAAQGIYSACYTFAPDVVIIVMGTFVPLETLDVIRARGATVVYLFTESPYEDERQLHQAPHADLVILNDPTNLEKFRAVNPDTFYVPHAYDPRKHYPGPGDPDKASDFAFVGTGFPSRVEFLEACDLDGLDVVLAGSWVELPESSPLTKHVAHPIDWCCDNDETADIYRSTKASLNLYRREVTHVEAGTPSSTADGWACGPREIELAACGTFFLRDPRPEGDELFPMLPTFSEPGEVRPLLDYYLTHDTEREEAALKAQAAIADRTFRANAEWLARHTGE